VLFLPCLQVNLAACTQYGHCCNLLSVMPALGVLEAHAFQPTCISILVHSGITMPFCNIVTYCHKWSYPFFTASRGGACMQGCSSVHGSTLSTRAVTLHGEDACPMCWEPLASAPAIMLTCGHACHLACAKEHLKQVWMTIARPPEVSVSPFMCSQCSAASAVTHSVAVCRSILITFLVLGTHQGGQQTTS